MNTKNIGNKAEDKAVEYLISNGYTIISRNWKNRWCEIDIIAVKNKIIYFIEVKYRKNDTYGDGVDAINAKKLKQMHFSADLWVNNEIWNGDYRLAVISISPQEIDFIEI